jgi:hypothetical protein
VTEHQTTMKRTKLIFTEIFVLCTYSVFRTSFVSFEKYTIVSIPTTTTTTTITTTTTTTTTNTT